MSQGDSFTETLVVMMSLNVMRKAPRRDYECFYSRDIHYNLSREERQIDFRNCVDYDTNADFRRFNARGRGRNYNKGARAMRPIY